MTTRPLPHRKNLNPLTLNPRIIITSLIIILAFISVMLMALTPASTNESTLREPGMDMMISGALAGRFTLNAADASQLSCSPDALQFSFPFSNDGSVMQVTLQSSQPLAANNVYSIDANTRMQLSLTDGTTPYHSFIATEGEISLNQANQGTFSAFFYDELGQSLFANGNWRCAS